ncbi:hypothetical protein [Kribbella turkmenica]|uniref:hypothetical protein n=1 Tax=Kribbella turkmenica TaxID=2530375 RepID=UPI001404D9C1|nr:hypothetical protein [Kribbella turkmenica]
MVFDLEEVVDLVHRGQLAGSVRLRAVLELGEEGALGCGLDLPACGDRTQTAPS